MDLRNRIGLYGAYFCGMAGIGFTLPFLPLYLSQQGMSDAAIARWSTLAALASLAQFPVGIASDRLGRRKPFLAVALGVLALATWLLPHAGDALWLGVLVVLFAENGICRAVVESLAGAEAASLAPAGEVGTALGALRFFKPLGIIAVAVAGSITAELYGVASILIWLAIVQTLALLASLVIHDRQLRISDFGLRIGETGPKSKVQGPESESQEPGVRSQQQGIGHRAQGTGRTPNPIRNPQSAISIFGSSSRS